jgi:hypothetical protein
MTAEKPAPKPKPERIRPTALYRTRDPLKPTTHPRAWELWPDQGPDRYNPDGLTDPARIEARWNELDAEYRIAAAEHNARAAELAAAEEPAA